MDDFAAAVEGHSCTKGVCGKHSHVVRISLVAGDVVDARAEIATLVRVRDELARRGYVWLEGEPTPRFAAGETEPKPWSVKYVAGYGRPAPAGSEATPAAPARRRGLLARLWSP